MLSPYTIAESSRRTTLSTTLPRTTCIQASPDSGCARRQPQTDSGAIRALL